MKTAYKFRLYPNRQQEAQLALTLDICRHLWNKALADRKNAWEREGITRSYEDQAALLVFEKQSNHNLNAVHSQVEQDAWYVIFTTELENPTKLKPKTTIGVDLGITHAAVTSDGQYFDYLKYHVQAEKKNRAANKSLHCKKLGSNNRKKAQTKLARIAKMVTNLREEFLHQVSRKLVNSADSIVFEDLSIQNMLKNHCLSKHIQDVSWGKLIRFTVSKAERAGKTVVLVNPYNTSQR